MPKAISSKTVRNLKNRLPALIWAGLIFMFSTNVFSAGNTGGILADLLRYFFSALSDDNIQLIHTLIRKLGHFSEYFILAVLILRALRQETGEKRNAPASSRTWADRSLCGQRRVPSSIRAKSYR